MAEENLGKNRDLWANHCDFGTLSVNFPICLISNFLGHSVWICAARTPLRTNDNELVRFRVPLIFGEAHHSSPYDSSANFGRSFSLSQNRPKNEKTYPGGTKK